MTPYLQQALTERATGLALHYPFLHTAILGLGARRTLEFGAGGSTRVFLDALPEGATHCSYSTETWEQVRDRYGINGPLRAGWTHVQGQSQNFRHTYPGGVLDLVLHDGSHAADVVAGDIAWAWPHLRRFGLLLVHDTQHSYCGAEMRAGVRRGLQEAGAKYTATTLPYGFGLTILRREDGEHPIVPACDKNGSPHRTEPTEMPL